MIDEEARWLTALRRCPDTQRDRLLALADRLAVVPTPKHENNVLPFDRRT